MTPPDVHHQLQDLCRSTQIDVSGVADVPHLRERFPASTVDVPAGLDRAVVIGVRLQDAVIEEIIDQPTALYFHLYRQANYHLDRAAFQIAQGLQHDGARSMAIPASQIVARDPMRGRVSHKLFAWAAGLGWYGRSSLLVHPEFGARVRYATILTDAPLECGHPLERDCGECRACVAVCPAGAIHTGHDDYDLDACYNKLTEFTRLPFIGQHICGVCIKACGGDGWPLKHLK